MQGRFLIVEGDGSTSRVIAQQLSPHREVLIASTLAAATRVAQGGSEAPVIGLVVNDLLPDGNSLEWLSWLRCETDVDAPVAVISARFFTSPESARRAAALGRVIPKPTVHSELADFSGALRLFIEESLGYEKDIAGLGERLQALARQRLTPTELRIAELGVTGMSRREIASVLGVSESTVRAHVNRLLGKCGMKGERLGRLRTRLLGPWP